MALYDENAQQKNTMAWDKLELIKVEATIEPSNNLYIGKEVIVTDGLIKTTMKISELEYINDLCNITLTHDG